MTSPSNSDPRRTSSASWSFARVLAWLGIVLLALGAWLALPRSRGARPPLEIVLVDVSKSVVGPRGSEWTSFVRGRIDASAHSAEERHADVCVIAFGNEVRTLVAPSPAREVIARLAADPRSPAGLGLLEQGAPSGANETKLAAALDLAASLAADRDATRAVILTDGTYTGRDPHAALLALERAGASVETPDVPGANRSNIALGPLSVPRAIEAGAPLVVSLEALIEPARDAIDKAYVEFVRRDEHGESTTRVDLQIADHASTRSIAPVHADLGQAVAGEIEIEARAVILDASGKRVLDAIPEDDVSRARVRCAGALVVGVADAKGTGAPMVALLNGLGSPSKSGVQIVALDERDLANALALVDALVTVDDPLGPDEAHLLASFVTRGGGWLDVAGWHWIEHRAQSTDPLSAIAALVPAHQNLGPRDVILLVDASGSMSGAPFESVRAALGPALEAALPEDDVEVRFFADDLSAPIRISAKERADVETRRAFLARAVHAREPQGSTQLWRALDAIATERASATRDALVILLSDGRDPDRSDVQARGTALRARLGGAHARVAVIAAGDDPDRDLLASLLLPGESMEDAGDLAKPDSSARLARAFTREIARDAVRAGPIDVVAVARASGPAAEIVRASQTNAPIARAVRAELAHSGSSSTDRAEVFWSAPDGAPLGAIARVGSGLVASLAFAPATDWAPKWNDAARLAPLLRLLARDHALRSNRPRLSEEDGRVCLENAPSDLVAPVQAHIVDGSGASADIVFAETGPSGDPLRERCAPIPPDLDRTSGFWTFTFDVGSGAPLVLALATPRAPEFTFPPRRFIASTSPDATPGSIGSPAPHPLHPWVILCGVVVLFGAALLGAFSRRRASVGPTRQAFPGSRR